MTTGLSCRSPLSTLHIIRRVNLSGENLPSSLMASRGKMTDYMNVKQKMKEVGFTNLATSPSTSDQHSKTSCTTKNGPGTRGR